MGKGLSTEDVLERFQKTHGNTYDYSKMEYTRGDFVVTIICEKHGPFLQRPESHWMGQGCKKCGNERHKYSQEEVLKKFKKIHGDFYDYSKVNYKRSDAYIIIVCPNHGEFLQKPSGHWNGAGCLKCSREARKMTRDKFISKSEKIHNFKFDYSKINFIDLKTHIEIMCPKHGPYLSTPTNHLQGWGCPSCRESKGEKKIRNVLEEYNFVFNTQYTFKDCVNPDTTRQLRYDFYIPKLNLVIEYDGVLHFKAIEHFGGAEALERRQFLDNIKNQYCINNNINILRIPYWKYDNIQNMIDQKIKERKENR